MSTIRKCIAGLLFALTAAAAQAAVMLQYSLSTNGGGSFSAPTVVNDGGAGDINPSLGSILSFTSAAIINGTASVTGFPALPQPNFLSGFSVSGVPVPNTILRLEYTQTGIPNASVAVFLSEFNRSGLQNVSATLSSFVSTADNAFGTEVLMASQTVTEPGNCPPNCGGYNFFNGFTPSPTHPSFSQTIRADISFFGGVFGALGVSMGMHDVTGLVVIPVPAAAWLLLSGLGVLGAMTRRRR